jgi:hypothetical protein
MPLWDFAQAQHENVGGVRESRWASAFFGSAFVFRTQTMPYNGEPNAA